MARIRRITLAESMQRALTPEAVAALLDVSTSTIARDVHAILNLRPLSVRRKTIRLTPHHP